MIEARQNRIKNWKYISLNICLKNSQKELKLAEIQENINHSTQQIHHLEEKIEIFICLKSRYVTRQLALENELST